jgi:hypothetical protein
VTHDEPHGDAATREREHERALEAALAEALASVHDRGAAPTPATVDYRWLRIGMRLGLERPGHARHLLELIGGREAAAAEAAVPEAAVPPAEGQAEVPPAEGQAPDEPAAVAAERAEADVPAVSLFLARSAAFSTAERAELGPEVVFGWATELTAGQVARLGGVVAAMLAEGARPEVGRGFALAWDDGAKIPRHERDTMFEDFTQLEVAVASVLVGRNLRAEETGSRPRGFGAFAQLFGSRSGTPSPTAAAIEAAGEAGRRGLVAAWNAWAAMRYRTLIPAPTFELLTRPWVTVVGPLPDR